jgi:hypothetical protein
VIATGQAILGACWHILFTRTQFAELGPDYYIRRHSPEAEASRLLRRLEALGRSVTIALEA